MCLEQCLLGRVSDCLLDPQPHSQVAFRTYREPGPFCLVMLSLASWPRGLLASWLSGLLASWPGFHSTL